MQNKVYPVSDLAKLAASIGVNETKFNACYNAKQTVALYHAYTSEGQKYGVEGTPGTLIIDTKTGKSAFVPGAYPVGTFINAIDAMKNAN